MIEDLLVLDDRRERERLTCQIPTWASDSHGCTLNLSLRGARLVGPQLPDQRFALHLWLGNEYLQLEAECVWSEPIAADKVVSGVRFSPGLAQQQVLKDLMDLYRQAS